jgi:REP element-mobilizing transposase RayT
LALIQRGNNRAVCFHAEDDYQFYLHYLKEFAVKFGCAIHAYVLMTNHVHLLLTPAKADSAGLMMKHLSVSADRAAALRVESGKLLSAQSAKITASLVASTTGRAAQQWSKYVIGAVAVIGSTAVMALDFALTSSTAHAPTVPDPRHATFTPK